MLLLLLQFGTQLENGASSGARARSRLLQRPWSYFQFFTGRPGMVLFSQAGSHNILCAELPLQGLPAKDVFIFGQHSGTGLSYDLQCLIPPTQIAG